MARMQRKQASFSNVLFLIVSFVFIEFNLFEFIGNSVTLFMYDYNIHMSSATQFPF
jgi:hypothetical protein